MLGLQLSPLLDLIGVVLQVSILDALYEDRQFGTPIFQSTDNKVGAVLCCPIQIDRSTICQLDRDEESLLVSFQYPSPHFGAGAFRCGCTLARRLETSIWPFAERRRCRRTRRLVRLRQETTKTAIRDAPTDGQRADAEATPCLAGLSAEKGDAREKVMLATRLTGPLDRK